VSRKQIAKNKFELWREKPDLFFEQVLGVTTLEGYQTEMLRTVAHNSRTSIRASHSLGKSWSVGRLALWFYTCFRNSLVITTAPTFTQVEALLWGEIRDAYKKSKYSLGGDLLRTKLKKSDKWYCVGLSPQRSAGESDEQLGSSFQGFHSDNIMIIFDESTGIALDVYRMAEGLMTSGKSVKMVLIGNPTTRSCEFFKTFSSPRYAKVHLSCFDSPNLKANGLNCVADIETEMQRLMLMPEDDRLTEIQNYKKPVPHLASAQWVVDFCLEYGSDHPLVVSKAFGNFPDDDESTLISMSDVEEAQQRDMFLDLTETRFIGVDVARFGDDKSVIIEMIGKKQTDMTVGVKQSTTYVAGLVMKMINNEYEKSKTTVLVDSTGIGAGVFDNLLENQAEGLIGRHVELVEIHFGAAPENKNETDKEKVLQDKARFFNLKSRMFQLLSNDMKTGLDIIDDSNFLKELPTIKALVDTKGRLRIESKSDYRKRTGRKSPDYSDALALCNFGRYVNIGFGSFKNQKTGESKPLVKRKKQQSRKSRIKTTSY